MSSAPSKMPVRSTRRDDVRSELLGLEYLGDRHISVAVRHAVSISSIFSLEKVHSIHRSWQRLRSLGSIICDRRTIVKSDAGPLPHSKGGLSTSPYECTARCS